MCLIEKSCLSDRLIPDVLLFFYTVPTNKTSKETSINSIFLTIRCWPLCAPRHVNYLSLSIFVRSRRNKNSRRVEQHEWLDRYTCVCSEGCNKNVVDRDSGNIWFVGPSDKYVVIGLRQHVCLHLTRNVWKVSKMVRLVIIISVVQMKLRFFTMTIAVTLRKQTRLRWRGCSPSVYYTQFSWYIFGKKCTSRIAYILINLKTAIFV